MSEAKATAEAPTAVEEDRNYRGVLRGLVGKKVTVVNPESYESAPMGYQLKAGFYPGKITGLGHDYIIFHTLMTTSKKEGQQQVQQFIPIERIKRLSLMKTGVLIHI